ncbi:hypothetical protein DFH08DRAFT_1086551 [Mycena albidolilacea]|uniref:Uncharacterized protein n=1 Tax=Mycena albidolilacea TaxID=1033008 RepID=A0AAD6ZED0_9AGAR|nr:hypothetical protein DFH08DRAFT_1086551 [Mycena albidolilacea]
MMLEVTTLHASMTGVVLPSPTARTSVSSSTASASATADTSSRNTKTTKAGLPLRAGGAGAGKRLSTKRARVSGAVRREPVEDSLGGLGLAIGMAHRPGTSRGRGDSGYMDVDADMDESPIRPTFPTTPSPFPSNVLLQQKH